MNMDNSLTTQIVTIPGLQISGDMEKNLGKYGNITIEVFHLERNHQCKFARGATISFNKKTTRTKYPMGFVPAVWKNWDLNWKKVDQWMEMKRLRLAKRPPFRIETTLVADYPGWGDRSRAGPKRSNLILDAQTFRDIFIPVNRQPRDRSGRDKTRSKSRAILPMFCL